VISLPNAALTAGVSGFNTYRAQTRKWPPVRRNHMKQWKERKSNVQTAVYRAVT